MKSTLYQLYEGNIFPLDDYRPLIKEHQELLKRHHLRFDCIKEKLKALDPELDWQLEQLLDEQYSKIYWDTAQMYIDGFRLGARMMIEVYQKDFSAEDTE